ncbi:MAG: hypothetical protein V4631_21205 [Pseudomonadota bacterium]
MSNVKYSDLLAEVLPHLKADPSDPLTESALKNAVIEFCRDSWVWRHFPDPLDVDAGEASYQLEPAAGADVAALLSCAYDGAPITPKSTDDLDAIVPDWQSVAGTVKYFTQIDSESVMLAPLPVESLAQGLVMVLALQPKRSAISFPKWISSQYMEALASGALARLMSMPDKPWTDQKGAALHGERFRNAVSAAKASGVRGLSRAVVRTTPQH